MSIADIDVLVLAGGLGTRLQEVLSGRPKVLAPVMEKPFLGHLLDWLTRRGVRRVILGLGYGAAEVCAYLDGHSFAPLHIRTIVEPEPLGTGGAVAYAAGSLTSEHVMVMNGDTIIESDLEAFLAEHLCSGAPASIICARVEDAARYGRVEIDPEGWIDHFAEKDGAFRGPAWISAGFYLFARAAIIRLSSPANRSLERDVLEKMPPRSIHAFRADGRFLDIGTPETLARASEVLTR
jgi:mannose-1-phosphate guanylyltransferase